MNNNFSVTKNIVIIIASVLFVHYLQGCKSDSDLAIKVDYVYSISDGPNYLEIVESVKINTDKNILWDNVVSAVENETVGWLKSIAIIYPPVDVQENCFIEEDSCQVLRLSVALNCIDCKDRKEIIRDVINGYIATGMNIVASKYGNNVVFVRREVKGAD